MATQSIRQLRFSGRTRMVPFLIAGLIVILGMLWGINGLMASPVRSLDGGGVAHLQGAWEPYQCDVTCGGYLQQGGRSVYVQLPSKCVSPARGSAISVTARRASQLGNDSYIAAACP